MTPQSKLRNLLIVLAASYVSLVLLDPDPPGNRVIRVGYFIGSLYAHASLAAAWSSLGPGRLRHRLPLSIVWILALPLAIGINVGWHGGPREVTIVLGACLVGQWILIQAGLYILVWGVGLRIAHREGWERCDGRFARQFQILDLMLVITVFAIVCAGFRALMPWLDLGGEGPSFIFLAIAAVLLTLPVLLSALLHKHAVLAVILSLVYVGVATYFEFSIMKALEVSGPKVGHFMAINTTSALLILVTATLLRSAGYCLYVRAA